MIRIDKLTKRYGSFTALNELTMEIEEGCVFGFVGPNGAGKTTTMSILATLLAPTSGRASVGGFDVTEHPAEVRSLIGYMPDFFGVYDQFKTVEYLDFYGASYHMPRSERRKLIPQLLELVNLTDKADAYVDSLSRGMKQRLCLARCLIHDPKVLILDEPASGLDPRARIEMREILKELKSMGKTIIISSHILPELAEMVDEIGVIEHGTLLSKGNVKEIESKLETQRILHIRVLSEDAGRLLRFLEEAAHVASVDEQRKDESTSTLSVHFSGTDEEQAELLKLLVSEQLSIVSYGEEKLDLEDVFLRITEGEGS